MADAITAVMVLVAGPVSAQYLNCPAGYVFSTGIGCVPATGAYNSFYGGPQYYGGGPQYYGAAPIYEPYGFAYGGLRGRFGGYRGPMGFHDGVGSYRGGEFRGGGFQGNGFHGGHR